jgi:hypothetical protein
MSAEPMVAQPAADEQQGIRIRQSETLGKLAAALAKAQLGFTAIEKAHTAQVESKREGARSYSYQYADLADVLAAVRKALAENGLALFQPLAWNGSPWLVTRLHHESDEWVESLYKLTEYDRPQDFGSAMTYARRYSITALLGIAAEEDDDGARAQEGQQRRGASKPALPACPHCKSAKRVMVSNRGVGYWCHACAKAFIDRTEDHAAAEAPAPEKAEPAKIAEATAGEPPRVQLPPDGDPRWENNVALGTECLRLAGNRGAATNLLLAIAGTTTVKGMKPDAVRGAWQALAQHDTFGLSKGGTK